MHGNAPIRPGIALAQENWDEPRKLLRGEQIKARNLAAAGQLLIKGELEIRKDYIAGLALLLYVKLL